MTAEREAMTLGQVRAEIASIEYECHKSALTLGVEGLRGMCIEAQKRLHKLLPAIDAHLSRAAEPVATIEVPPGDQADTYYPGYRVHHHVQLDAGMHRVFTHPPEPARDVKEIEALRYALVLARARNEHLFKTLMGIHAFVYPPKTVVEGKTYVFTPPIEDANKWMQAISDRIRAIPDEVSAAMAQESGDAT